MDIDPKRDGMPLSRAIDEFTPAELLQPLKALKSERAALVEIRKKQSGKLMSRASDGRWYPDDRELRAIDVRLDAAQGEVAAWWLARLQSGYFVAIGCGSVVGQPHFVGSEAWRRRVTLSFDDNQAKFFPLDPTTKAEHLFDVRIVHPISSPSPAAAAFPEGASEPSVPLVQAAALENAQSGPGPAKAPRNGRRDRPPKVSMAILIELRHRAGLREDSPEKDVREWMGKSDPIFASMVDFNDFCTRVAALSDTEASTVKSDLRKTWRIFAPK